MTVNDSAEEARNTTSSDWGQMMNEFWSPLINQWGGLFKVAGTQDAMKFKGRVGESFQTTAKMWKTMLDAMSEPAAVENFQKATRMTPDIALGFAQTCVKSFTDLQTQVGEWIQKRGTSLSLADVQELDKEMIKRWTEVYEKEFSQYLKIPQIGLGRFYQERVMQATDKLNGLQTSLSEFLHMLSQPVEKSLKSLQEKMVEMPI